MRRGGNLKTAHGTPKLHLAKVNRRESLTGKLTELNILIKQKGGKVIPDKKMLNTTAKELSGLISEAKKYLKTLK